MEVLGYWSSNYLSCGPALSRQATAVSVSATRDYNGMLYYDLIHGVLPSLSNLLNAVDRVSICTCPNVSA